MKTKTPYQIALIGSSGHGKTMSFRNMNPNTTGFINAENKPLPFKNEFKFYCSPKSWQETYQKLIEYAKNDEIEVVVLDSFSAYVESLLRNARDTKRNFDIWNMYNDEIGKLTFIIKNYPKHIIVSAHSNIIETQDGVEEKRMMVKGGEWNKASVEKEFTIVHYAGLRVIDGKRKYTIALNSDGKNTAKTPPMFLVEGEEEIDNDYDLFIKRINEVLNKQ